MNKNIKNLLLQGYVIHHEGCDLIVIIDPSTWIYKRKISESTLNKYIKKNLIECINIGPGLERIYKIKCNII